MCLQRLACRAAWAVEGILSSSRGDEDFLVKVIALVLSFCV
jgi:hypothetical protein